MKKIKAWAVFNQWGEILLEAIDLNKKDLLEIRDNYNAISPGYRIRRITITVEE